MTSTAKQTDVRDDEATHLALVIEDSAAHREVLLSLLNRPADGMLCEAFHDDFQEDAVFAWLTDRIENRPGAIGTTVIIDLAWLTDSERQMIEPGLESDKPLPALYWARLADFLRLVLCPGGKHLQLDESNWSEGLRLIHRFRKWEFERFGSSGTVLTNLALVVVSSFGLESVRQLAMHVGADWTIQKFPDLAQYYAQSYLPDREESRARFQYELTGRLHALYQHLVCAQPPRLRIGSDANPGRLTVDIRLARGTEDPSEDPTINAAIRQLEHRPVRPIDSCKPHESLPLDEALLKADLDGFLAWALTDRSYSAKRYIYQALEHTTRRVATMESSIERAISRMLVGRSLRQSGIIRRIARFAQAEDIRSVLVTGETGTGKEVVARALSEFSTRPAATPILVDLSQLRSELAPSYIFGHTRGAFTGAHGDRLGQIAHAQGGWLHIDEITAADSELQALLMRFIETGEYHRVGETGRLRTSNARLVLSCTPDLTRLPAQIVNRLYGAHIELSTLDERGTEDVRDLIQHFMALRNELAGPRSFVLDADVIGWLVEQSWDDNVRMLRAVLDAACGTALATVSTAAASQPTTIRVSQAYVEEAYKWYLTHALEQRCAVRLSKDPAQGVHGSTNVASSPFDKSARFAMIAHERMRRTRPGSRAIARTLGTTKGRVEHAVRKIDLIVPELVKRDRRSNAQIAKDLSANTGLSVREEEVEAVAKELDVSRQI